MNSLNHLAQLNEQTDATPFARAAIQELMTGETQKLVFPKGRYNFWPDKASEAYLFISNNDESLKRIVFDLRRFNYLEIDGGGSEFVFHGTVIPFALQNCHNARLSNFTINWDRTYHSEAKILGYRPKADASCVLDLQISNQFPFVVKNGKLLFELEDCTTECLGHVLEFDPIRRETASRVHDNGVAGQYTATMLDDNIVRIEGRLNHAVTPGNTLVMTAGKRYSPAIALLDCSDISIADVTIHHCGGMGIIAQRTRNVDLQRVYVTPDTRRGRMISTTADAAHFVNCAGLININDCVFENQMDDPVNIHGIYGRVSAIISRRTVEIELVHEQQRGVDITQAGDTVEFVANENLLTYGTASVKSFNRLNKQFYQLTAEDAFPERLKIGDGVASLGWIPDVTITNTTSRNNRARGFLISTAGKVVIEGNYFHTPGSAILIAGDANYWFESGKVRNVTIRNNHFDNCMFGVWGVAVIGVQPEIPEGCRDGVYYHENITIENNRFDLCDGRVLYAHCVDGIKFLNNSISTSSLYEFDTESDDPISLEACSNLEVDLHIPYLTCESEKEMAAAP